MSMAASESYISNLYAEDLPYAASRHKAFSKNLYQKLLVCVELVADVLTGIGSIVAAYLLQLRIGGHVVCPWPRVMAFGVVYGLFAILLLKAVGAYGSSHSLMRIRETGNAVRVAVQSSLLLLLVNSIFQLKFPLQAFCITMGVGPILLILQKQLLYSITRILHSRGCGADRVIVCGMSGRGKCITSTLLNSPKLGLYPIAVWSGGLAPHRNGVTALGYSRNVSVPIYREPMTPTLLKALRCDLLIVASAESSTATIDHIASVANRAAIPIAFLSGVALLEGRWQKLLDLDGHLLASSDEPFETWHYAVTKRVVDMLVSSLLLVVLSPLLLLIALLIRLGSPGPALFVQKRVGRDGELFDMYKFRSMHVGAPMYAVSPMHSADPRITRFGRLLRKTSLDELPQLMNVFLGKMSLVGPRPEMPFVVASYTGHQRQRLQAKPGITGLWQLSGDRAFPIHENLEYDLYYIRNRSFFMDLAILIHTLFFAIGGGI
jgi:exopolysaccharide biosynthesis polyprenyl glycosylphosphotransferase